MNYLSKPITGFLLLTSQLFSGRVISLITIGFRLDVRWMPPHRQCFNVSGNL